MRETAPLDVSAANLAPLVLEYGVCLFVKSTRRDFAKMQPGWPRMRPASRP
jgi:hypothetical protein